MPVQIEQLRTRGKEQLRKTVDRFRPTAVAETLTKVDMSPFRAKGVNTLILDAEGTFVTRKGWEVSEEVKTYLADQREQGIKHIAIVSNNTPESRADWVRLTSWAEQIGADAVFVPLASDERKPAPTLLLKAAAQFGITPEQALVVGDKLTADIAAANDAGMQSVWVERLGKQDVIGDRVIRRPVEKGIQILQRRMKPQGTAEPAPDDLQATPAIQFSFRPAPKPAWAEAIPQALWDSSKISGFGAPVVQLEGETAEKAKHWSSGTVDSLLSAAGSEYKSQFDAFMSEHGRGIANGATWARLIAAPIIAGLILTNRWDTARPLFAAATLSDFVDGIAARRSKDGATRSGGKFDQRVDKVFTTLTEFSLYRKDRLSREDFTARGVVDLAKLAVRKHYDDAGVDTKAILAGKLAFTAQVFADFYAMTDHAGKNPRVNKIVQRSATGIKIGAAAINIVNWELKKRDLDKAKQVETQLLEAQTAKTIPPVPAESTIVTP